MPAIVRDIWALKVLGFWPSDINCACVEKSCAYVPASRSPNALTMICQIVYIALLQRKLASDRSPKTIIAPPANHEPYQSIDYSQCLTLLLFGPNVLRFNYAGGLPFFNSATSASKAVICSLYLSSCFLATSIFLFACRRSSLDWVSDSSDFSVHSRSCSSNS